MARIRYSTEQKAEALQLCDAIGVQKASEQLGITVNSLYAWRNAQKKEQQEAKATPPAKAPATPQPPIEEPPVDTTPAPIAQPAQTVGVQATEIQTSNVPTYEYSELVQLRIENKVLREQNDMLKAALRSFTQ